MQAFWLALQFLTRLPSPTLQQLVPQAVGRSLLFYPLIGLLIGALLLATGHLATRVFDNTLIVAALVVVAWLWLSGALHVDGLADMADAWVGGQGDRERTLAIMKDPYCGPMGVAAVVALLLLKFAAVVALLPTQPQLLLLAPIGGRSFAVLLMLTTPYCRDAGLASDMVRYLPRRAAWAILLLFAAIVLWWWRLDAIWLLGITLLLFGLYRRALLRRLQGFSGDAAGALIEMVEVAILLTGAGIML